MDKLSTLVLVAILLAFVNVGCDSVNSQPPEADGNEDAPPDDPMPDDEPQVLTLWKADFDVGVQGWTGSEGLGSLGWCGTVEQVGEREGNVTPSQGTGYAVVRHGKCNAHWDSQGWEGSGPFTYLRGHVNRFPETGMVNELDVYLDPDWGAGHGFDFTVTAADDAGRILQSSSAGAGWFIIHVASDSSTGKLLVAGADKVTVPNLQERINNLSPRQDLENRNHFEVVEAGWYTIRHVFRDDDGILKVDVQLLRDDRILFTKKYTMRPLTGRKVGDLFEAWFMFLTDDLNIPIDEHKLYTYE